MKSFVTLFAATLMVVGSASAATVTDPSFITYTVHANGFVSTGEFHGSGNTNIPFNEYDLAGFNLTSADFGGQVEDITSATLTLSHDPKSFTSGTSFELFFSADDFGSGYGGLSFDASGSNDPYGIDATQFGSLVSLGVYPFTNKPYGDTTSYNLNLSSIEAALIDEINNGSDFHIIIAADAGSNITFQGVGPRFDTLPAVGPQLTIAATIPEPSSLMLAMGSFLMAGIARRK